MYKYTFKIRARTGIIVENLTVHARDRLEAEKKLAQIYRDCEFLECREVAAPMATEGLDFESVLSAINKQAK
ncbi:MAG TPA: hypothetical protein VFP62_10115 [Burkholderiales bacterium]|jgi:hypothetical protein|nr:hypothetical protein [Burkholderiales bacterium]